VIFVFFKTTVGHEPELNHLRCLLFCDNFYDVAVVLACYKYTIEAGDVVEGSCNLADSYSEAK